MKVGSMYGGCFPSSHVAAACVALVMMARYEKKIYNFMLPLVICLCISTVYCHYHYILDVFAGIIVCYIALYLRVYFQQKFTKLKEI